MLEELALVAFACSSLSRFSCSLISSKVSPWAADDLRIALLTNLVFSYSVFRLCSRYGSFSSFIFFLSWSRCLICSSSVLSPSLYWVSFCSSEFKRKMLNPRSRTAYTLFTFASTIFLSIISFIKAFRNLCLFK